MSEGEAIGKVKMRDSGSGVNIIGTELRLKVGDNLIDMINNWNGSI